MPNHAPVDDRPLDGITVAHLTTVDLSLRYLLLAQLLAVTARGGRAIGVSGPGPDVAELHARGIVHIPLPSSQRGANLRADLGAARELWTVLRTTDVDVLHTHNPKPGVYGRVLGRVAGVPIVVNTVHGLYATETDRWLKRAVVYALEVVAARCSDAELVQNPEDLAILRRLPLYPARRLALLGNGIDLDRFRPGRLDDGERAAARRALGIREDQLVIGTVGRLVAEKGYPELFEAARRLGDGYVLVAVGPDDPTKADALQPDVVARAAENGVLLLGMRTDIDRIYAVFDVFVLASHREGFPRAAMEAAACGLPVVTTDVRGCRQVVDDGVNGRLVPVNDATALAGAIEELGRDPGLRGTMGRAGRIKAEAEFDERRVVDTVIDTYTRLLMRRTSRGSRRGRTRRAAVPRRGVRAARGRAGEAGRAGGR